MLVHARDISNMWTTRLENKARNLVIKLITIVHGNLLESDAKFICHQVNCQGVMGSGVAKQVREKWPIVYRAYKELCDANSGKREGLLSRTQWVLAKNDVVVINIFAQLSYGRDGAKYTDLESLRVAFEGIAAHVGTHDPIAMPYRIGCGLGGADWGKVMDMLTDIFSEHSLTLYKI